MRRGFQFLAVAAAVFSSAGHAAEWSCSNRDLAEIRCGADGCEIERESFTPMSVTVADHRIEICAYSGCFAGAVTLRRTRGDHLLLSTSVRSGGAPETASVTLVRSSRTAVLVWKGFANVMRCEAAE
jgi:hypothetical protein